MILTRLKSRQKANTDFTIGNVVGRSVVYFLGTKIPNKTYMESAKYKGDLS